MRILIVEDEPKTASYLRNGLVENGFVVDVSHRGDDGLHAASAGEYDLIILDVILPERDGWSVLSSLQAAIPRLLKLPKEYPCPHYDPTSSLLSRRRSWP
jgi:two-component system copper resistance phosphate regulon response regulator CusR